ncbi:hypothetical protein ACTMU2_04650 [Cupriavidus basilensis]
MHSVTDMLPQLNEQAPHFAFFITPAVRPYIDANKLRAPCGDVARTVPADAGCPDALRDLQG